MRTKMNLENAPYTGPVGPDKEHDVDPREFFRVLWRRKWLILLCVTLIPLAAYFYSDRLTKSFQSSAIVQVQNTATDGGLFVDQDLPSGTANTAKVAALVSTSGVADETARLMGEPEGSLSGAISATDDEDTGFITITATAGTGQRAAEIANATARALRVTRRQAGIRRVDASIANVEKDLAKLPRGRSSSAPSSRSACRASVPFEPHRHRTPRWSNLPPSRRVQSRRTPSATRSLHSW